jgi:DNA polymerase III subunit chi
MQVMSLKAAFYLLAETTLKARDLYACRLIEKAYSNDLKIYVHIANEEEAQKFDTQLWTFRDISFVPHEIYNQNSTAQASVLIGFNTTPTEKKDMLINLTTEIPSFHQQFNHIIEIIPDDKDLRAAARKKYKAYQQLGYQMETFNIKAF